MTPMIDVVFLLLVFFIWTSSFQIVENLLPSHLAAVSGTDPTPQKKPPLPDEDFDKIVVRVMWVNGAPQWRVSNVAIKNLSQVRERLETISRITREAPVILHPDPDVPLGHVIDAYDIIRLAGFEKIQFAASEAV